MPIQRMGFSDSCSATVKKADGTVEKKSKIGFLYWKFVDLDGEGKASGRTPVVIHQIGNEFKLEIGKSG